MTVAEEMAAFICRATFDDLATETRQQLKIRVLDALACAIGAVEGEPVRLVREHVTEFGSAGPCTLLGGGRATPEHAAFYNSALVRYLDFNDSYLAPGETCHPSDNLGAVLAASEAADRNGRDLLLALALAYQVQCRLADDAPLRARGFDHTTQGAYAVAAGVSSALGLDRTRTASALGICGTAFNALRVTRTGPLSHWKGLAYPCTAFSCTFAVRLAMRGVSGPLQVFEGNKGFIETISGPFRIDWLRERLDRPALSIVKRFNAEIHSQSVLEAVVELKAAGRFSGDEVQEVLVEVFDVAYHIIGGGEEGDKKEVHSKEQADHSLPYLVAVAILDGEVTPRQYRPDRIQAEDVQSLLRRVRVLPREEFSRGFPSLMPCRVHILLRDGRRLEKEKQDYQGFHTRPMPWQEVVDKFETLSRPYTDAPWRAELENTVAHLEETRVRELTRLLGEVRLGSRDEGAPVNTRAAGVTGRGR